MGLVNLKQIHIAFFSLNDNRITPFISICKENKYPFIYVTKNIPELINTLKSKKINALIFDPRLGETNPKELHAALVKSFPKTKLLSFFSSDEADLKELFKSLGLYTSLQYPPDKKEYIRILQEIAMENLGIKSSQMTVDDNF